MAEWTEEPETVEDVLGNMTVENWHRERAIIEAALTDVCVPREWVDEMSREMDRGHRDDMLWSDALEEGLRKVAPLIVRDGVRPHDWVDLTNPVVTGGEMCTRCGRLRAATRG